MKHVFLIHSSITYLATLSVIAHEDLNPDDCMILCSKDMSFEEVLPIIYMNREKELKKETASAKRIRNFISKRGNGDDYILYIPVMGLLAKMLVTSPHCKGLRFFEEGIAAYISDYNLEYIACEYFQQKSWTLDNWRDYVNLLSRVVGLFLRGVTIKMISLPFHYLEYAQIKDVLFYGLNERTFPVAKNKKIIDIHNKYTNRLKVKYNLDNSHIWVSSEFFVDTYTPSIKIHYQKKLKSYFEKNDIKAVKIKFHQSESEFSRNITYQMFDEIGIKYELIPDNTIMEIELLNAKNVTMYGDCSSLLMYNAEFGHKSITVVKDLEKNPDIDRHFIKVGLFNLGEDFMNIMGKCEFI